MSAAPADQANFPVIQRGTHTSCYYKCVSCGQRFWQKKALVRRAAKCKGTMTNPASGISQACKAWRCRYNDQCPGAANACAICGTTEPSEFMPARPATVSSPAFVSRPAFSSDPRPSHSSNSPANYSPGGASQVPGGNQSKPFHGDYVIPEQQGSFLRQANITMLPLYGDVVERYLTEA